MATIKSLNKSIVSMSVEDGIKLILGVRESRRTSKVPAKKAKSLVDKMTSEQCAEMLKMIESRG